jgi:hypothetical protein
MEETACSDLFYTAQLDYDTVISIDGLYTPYNIEFCE